MVDGETTGEHPRKTRPLLDKWIPRGYPALYVEYKGRGVEWFDYEVPHMFDWMDHKRDLKKRATGLPQLGKFGNGGPLGEEFQAMRQSDNRFYWLSTTALTKGHFNDGEDWNPRITAGSFQGQIFEGNQLNINVRCVHDVTIWFTKDMIDYSKPVTVRINGVIRMQNQKITPSLHTLLEDLYQRGDRQRLFWAKAEFDRP
jgi:hypothetical protein